MENVQEAVDATLRPKIAEDPGSGNPSWPMDGFILTHAPEPVELLDKEKAREFLPDFKPASILDPNKPLTLELHPTTHEFHISVAAHQKALKIEQWPYLSAL